MSESYYNSVLMPLDRIRSARTGMSKTQTKIAEYLSSSYESAAVLTSESSGFDKSNSLTAAVI